MAKNELSIFNFNSNPVRIQKDKEGKPLWCLKDVCKALEIKNHKQVVSRLTSKGVYSTYLLTGGGKQDMLFIDESNLYRVIFRSDKKEAVAFQDWVFNEVLPTLRSTGSYSVKEVEELKEQNAKFKLFNDKLHDDIEKEKEKYKQVLKEIKTIEANYEEKLRLQAPKMTLPLLITRVKKHADERNVCTYEIWKGIYDYMKKFYDFNVFDHKKTFGSCQEAIDHMGYLDKANEWFQSN